MSKITYLDHTTMICPMLKPTYTDKYSNIIPAFRSPVRQGYGLHERKMCPTREQGTTLAELQNVTDMADISV